MLPRVYYIIFYYINYIIHSLIDDGLMALFELKIRVLFVKIKKRNHKEQHVSLASSSLSVIIIRQAIDQSHLPACLPVRCQVSGPTRGEEFPQRAGVCINGKISEFIFSLFQSPLPLQPASTSSTQRPSFIG